MARIRLSAAGSISGFFSSAIPTLAEDIPSKTSATIVVTDREAGNKNIVESPFKRIQSRQKGIAQLETKLFDTILHQKSSLGTRSVTNWNHGVIARQMTLTYPIAEVTMVDWAGDLVERSQLSIQERRILRPEMVTSEPFVVVPLTSSDIDDAQVLVAEAGWNQTPADWRIFLELGRAWSARAHDGTLVGTAAALPYTGGFGWISMLLVAKAWRGLGIGTRLLNCCVETLRGLGLIPMLDATPAGREVYRRLGFRDMWPITRRRREAAVEFRSDAANVRPLKDRDLANIVTFDTAAFGCNRDKLLDRLRDRSRDFACAAETNGQVRGFLLGRNGRTATHFGPVVAVDEHTATSLVDFAGGRVCSPVMLDVPDQHDVLAQWLANHGFVRERPLMRMIFGSDQSFGDSRQVFAIAGPELG